MLNESRKNKDICMTSDHWSSKDNVTSSHFIVFEMNIIGNFLPLVNFSFCSLEAGRTLFLKSI